MRLALIAGAAMLFQTNCADRYLDERENVVLGSDRISAASSLHDQSAFAQEMSEAYQLAARDSANAQDIAAFGITLAAASAVSGAVSQISNTAIANRALVGAGLEVGAKRTVPKTAIVSIYTGAKRLNCISAVSAAGIQVLADTSQRSVLAARALTFGAIREVMITTREGLVREVPDYSALVSELSDTGIDPAGLVAPDDFSQLDKYLKLLSNCLAEKPTLKDGTVN